jgi:hypothetical protein
MISCNSEKYTVTEYTPNKITNVRSVKITEGCFSSMFIVDSLLFGENYTNCIFSELQPKELFDTHELSLLNDNIVGRGFTDYSKDLFFIYNIMDDKIKWIPYHPKFRFEERYNTLVYDGSLCVNDNKGVIVYASRYFDEVLFYNSDGKLLNGTYFSKIKKPELSKMYSGADYKTMLYFFSVYGTPSNCYVTRIAKPWDSLPKGNDLSIPTDILIFNWDGVLIDTYQYESLMSSFCIDEETGRSYCIINPEIPEDFSVYLTEISLKK